MLISVQEGTCLLPFSTSNTTAHITPTTPIPLSTVFVSANSYQQSPDVYYQHILRQGELSVLATEPVLQGIAVRDYTKFVLVPTLESESDGLSTSSAASISDASESIHTSESDALEIDEDFLRDSSVYSPLPLTPIPVPGMDTQSVCVSTLDLAKMGMLSGDWVSIPPDQNIPAFTTTGRAKSQRITRRSSQTCSRTRQRRHTSLNVCAPLHPLSVQLILRSVEFTHRPS